MKIIQKLLILLFITFSFIYKIHAYELIGKIIIKNTTIPVKKAFVHYNGKKLKTNNKGEFVLKELTGPCQIIIAKDGYKKLQFDLEFYEDIEEIFEMELESVINATKQTVYADRTKDKVSFYKVKQKTIKRLSENSLFADTLAGLQMLPGVASNRSFDASMYIRGGNSYEIIGILDDSPVFRPYFFGGLLSIFNPRIVDSVDFYPGGYDASYSQSLSGVIDVHTVDGNFEEFQSDIDVNLTEMNYFVTTPLQKGKSTWMASYRRTYYDLLVPLASSLSGTDSPIGVPFLQAFQTKYTDKLNKSNKMRINVAYFNEGADMEITSEQTNDEDMEGDWAYDHKMFIASMQLDSILGDSFLNKLVLSFNKRLGFNTFSSAGLSVDNDIDLATFIIRDDLTFNLDDAHQIKTGILLYQAYDSESSIAKVPPNPWQPGSVTMNTSYRVADPFYVLGTYIQDEWKLFPANLLSFGLRLDYTRIGDYDWKPILSPRISYLLEYDDTTKIKAYYGKYNQLRVVWNTVYPNILNKDTIEAELANVGPETAWHYGLGLEKYFTEDILFKTEIFYKDYDQMIIDNAEYPISEMKNNGDGKAGGIEFMLQNLSENDYSGWITYTYSKTQREDKEGTYYPHFDRTHMINIYGDYKISTVNNLIFTIKYNTGQVYTPILGSETNQMTGATEYIEGERFSMRLPDYFRLDIWYKWSGVTLILPIPFLPISENKVLGIFPAWNFKGVTRLGLFNLLNNVNAVGTYWDKDNKEQGFISDFPRMPIFGFRIDF